MEKIQLTDGQREAVNLIKKRYEDKEPITIISGAAGTGKAMPTNMVIPTPNGNRLFGSLKVGDSVYGTNGQATFVKGVYPQGELDAYLVSFSDGRQTVCNDEHLWGVVEKKKEYRVMTTKELMESSKLSDFALPRIAPVEREEIHFPIPPFLMGFLMFRGYVSPSGTIEFSTRKNSLLGELVLKELESLGVYSLKAITHKRKDDNRFSKDEEVRLFPRDENGKTLKWVEVQQYFPESLKPKVSERSLPAGYLRGSVHQRYELLAGILAAKGKKNNRNLGANDSPFYMPANRPQLSAMIQELVHSLGITFKYLKHRGTDALYFRFTAQQKRILFRRSHPNDLHTIRGKGSRPYFASIKKLPQKMEMQCISVSAENKLFLAERYIPTHNTTVVNTIIDELDLKKDQVLFATYTGKAAKVLQSKGVPAKTIHKSFYSSRLMTPKNQEPYFIHSPLSGIDFHGSFPNNSCRLIVLDEASMVPGSMLEIIKTYGVPIICLGDNYQLGPVETEGEPTSGSPGVAQLLKTPDVELTEIMRQAAGSGIIQVGQMLRQGIVPQPGDYGADMKVIRMPQLHMGMLKWADQILVAKNTTRKQYNNLMRAELGFTAKIPEQGEKLICLKNVWEAESSTGQPLINGAQVQVNSFVKPGRSNLAEMSAMDLADGGEYFGHVAMDNFKATKSRVLATKKAWQFDYGYAISIWKSQGSQWPKVLVIGEYHSHQTQEEYTQMLYTAITRAEQGCVLVLPF